MKSKSYLYLFCCLCGIIFPGTLVLQAKAASDGQNLVNVSGKVTDTQGEPIIGASVLVSETGTGTITDLDGRFVINVFSDAVLHISSIGFETVEVNVEGKTYVEVVMKQQTTALDEVVVVGYGTIKRKEMTSAISHVGAKDLNQVSSLDASMMLQGKVSGVSVTNTGVADPNQQGSIQVRGISSRNAGLGPLVVVDGIPGGDLTNINPADIESIDVLKDGAASAIYGTRGSNGVVLVNLRKSAKDGNIHTSYSTQVTFNSPKKELDVLNAAQWRAYRSANNAILDGGGDTDWFDEVTRTGFSHMHTVTLSGGNAKTNYRVTADYRDAKGVDIRSYRKEYGGRANVNHTTRDGLFFFSANIAPRVIDREKSDWGVFSDALKNNPTTPVWDEENEHYTRFSGGIGSNIVETLLEVDNGSEIKLLEWNATAGINLLPLFTPGNPDLSLQSQVTVSQYQVDKFNYTFSPSTYGPNILSGYAGQASRSFDKSTENNLEWVTNFSAMIDGQHQLRAMLGYSYNYGVYSGMSAENKDFSSDLLSYNNLGSGSWATLEGHVGMGSYKNDHTLIGFFGRISYDWKSRYMMTVSLRYEGSSRFGANNKWGYFPAVSIGWRLSDEPFMKGLKWMDDLKLRYDYGITGNQEIGNYNSLATYKAYGTFYYNGQWNNVWGPAKNVNADLRWEKGHNQNIGMDFSFFNYRLSGSFNYFIRRQSDLLGTYKTSVPPNLFDEIYANVGTLRNTGFEFDLAVEAVRSENFTWNLTLIGATNSNKFMSFSNDVYTGQSYYLTCGMSNPNNPGYLQKIEEGERIGNYFTYRYAGVDNNGDWLVYDRKGNVIPIAEAEEDDKTVTGNGLPIFTGAITSNMVWRNFDLSLSLRCALGYEIFNVHDFYYGLQSMSGNLLTSAFTKNAHITTGKNIITDYFIEPGDYLKIDNVTLGYTLDLNKKFLQKIRFYGTAGNLYTFTRFTGVDPSTYETNGLTPGTLGGGYSYYPSCFQFILGLQVSF